ncbi:MAG: Hpt domain-containing protein [Gammaproteobacteria bacterium]|nr:Hpt domain-containing protein [Gammaproteobacteria bacterium]
MNTDQAHELPDLPGIDVQAGLKVTRNNVQLYRRLLLKFLDGQQNYLDQFAEARSQQDHLAMSRVAHTLKGVAGNLGISSIYDIVVKLEAACNSEADNIDELLNTTIARLATVCNDIVVLRDENA